MLESRSSIRLLVYLLLRLKQILETNILFGGIQLRLTRLVNHTNNKKSQAKTGAWLVMYCITWLVTLVMDGEISWNSFRFFTLLQESDIQRNLIYIGLDWIGSFSGIVTMNNRILISVTSFLITDINVQKLRIKNALTKPPDTFGFLYLSSILKCGEAYFCISIVVVCKHC